MTACVVDIVLHNECCGCEACANVCPISCIKMVYDEEGFLNPIIDKRKCIQCGKCVRVCPIKANECKESIKRMYGGTYKNDEIVKKSSSGGAFYLLASKILENGGSVCGAVLDKRQHVKHIIADSVEELYCMLGSKYVQSEMGNIFLEVEKRLEIGKEVLFTGSPCQASAMRDFFGNKYKSLYIVEFICHGVPSPLVWEEYIEHVLNQKQISDECRVEFRSKERKGWHDSELKINSEEKRIYAGKREDIFYNAFLENLFLRESCYNCKFKGETSYADVSIADCWGSEKYIPQIDKKYHNDGISLVTIFTDKGMCLFNSCKKNFDFEEIFDKDVWYTNSASMISAYRNKKREKFFRCREKEGTYSALKKYGTYTAIKKMKNKIKWKIMELKEK